MNRNWGIIDAPKSRSERWSAVPSWATKIIQQRARRIFDETAREDFEQQGITKFLELSARPEGIPSHSFFNRSIRNLFIDRLRNAEDFAPITSVDGEPTVRSDGRVGESASRHSKAWTILWYRGRRLDGTLIELDRETSWASEKTARAHAERERGLYEEDGVEFLVFPEGSAPAEAASGETKDDDPTPEEKGEKWREKFYDEDAAKNSPALLPRDGREPDVLGEEEGAPGSGWGVTEASRRVRFQPITTSVWHQPDPTDAEAHGDVAPTRANLIGADGINDFLDWVALDQDVAVARSVLIEGKTFAQIGEELRISPSTLYKRWKVLASKYREHLDAHPSRGLDAHPARSRQRYEADFARLEQHRRDPNARFVSKFRVRREYSDSPSPLFASDLRLGLYGLRTALNPGPAEWVAFDYDSLPLAQRKQNFWVDDTGAGEDFPWKKWGNEHRHLSRITSAFNPNWLVEVERKWERTLGQIYSHFAPTVRAISPEVGVGRLCKNPDCHAIIRSQDPQTYLQKTCYLCELKVFGRKCPFCRLRAKSGGFCLACQTAARERAMVRTRGFVRFRREEIDCEACPRCGCYKCHWSKKTKVWLIDCRKEVGEMWVPPITNGTIEWMFRDRITRVSDTDRGIDVVVFEDVASPVRPLRQRDRGFLNKPRLENETIGEWYRRTERVAPPRRSRCTQPDKELERICLRDPRHPVWRDGRWETSLVEDTAPMPLIRKYPPTPPSRRIRGDRTPVVLPAVVARLYCSGEGCQSFIDVRTSVSVGATFTCKLRHRRERPDQEPVEEIVQNAAD